MMTMVSALITPYPAAARGYSMQALCNWMVMLFSISPRDSGTFSTNVTDGLLDADATVMAVIWFCSTPDTSFISYDSDDVDDGDGDDGGAMHEYPTLHRAMFMNVVHVYTNICDVA